MCRRGSVRMNAAQKLRLVELMTAYNLEYKSMFSPEKNATWITIATTLNKLGPFKDVHQWKMCWTDMKKQVKAKLLKCIRNTPNNLKTNRDWRTDISDLTEIDKKIIKICRFKIKDENRTIELTLEGRKGVGSNVESVPSPIQDQPPTTSAQLVPQEIKVSESESDTTSLSSSSSDFTLCQERGRKMRRLYENLTDSLKQSFQHSINEEIEKNSTLLKIVKQNDEIIGQSKQFESTTLQTNNKQDEWNNTLSRIVQQNKVILEQGLKQQVVISGVQETLSEQEIFNKKLSRIVQQNDIIIAQGSRQLDTSKQILYSKGYLKHTDDGAEQSNLTLAQQNDILIEQGKQQLEISNKILDKLEELCCYARK